MSSAASNEGPQDLTEVIIERMLGPKNSGIRAQIKQIALQRGNTPARGVRHKLVQGGPPRQDGTLWVVDRIIEPQTIAHFIQSALTGSLPGNRTLTLPILDEEIVVCLTTPPSTWAPAPYNTRETPYIQDLMTRIGSNEDSDRLQVVSKDLQFAKTRIWEGMPPLSQRRWEERELDHPAQFPQACQLIVSVIEVFYYLQTPQVAWALRETYNLFYAHLLEFQKTINAKLAAEGKDSIQVANIWAEFMTAKFAMMEDVAHSWCTEHITFLKQRCLQNLRNHQPSEAAGGSYDEVQWTLTNMWQDLVENQGQADFAIFLPIEGYRGVKKPSATGRPVQSEVEAAMYAGTSTLKFNVRFDQRMKGYHLRRRQIGLMDTMRQVQENILRGERMSDRPQNDPTGLAELCEGQDMAQIETRKELRGEPHLTGKAAWIAEAKGKNLEVVAYRTHYDLKDDEWDWFVQMFEEDFHNWGEELVDASEVKEKVKIVWRDARKEGIETDFVALNEHYNSIRDDDAQGFYLVADKLSVDSYFSPSEEVDDNVTTSSAKVTSLPGDCCPCILAQDPDFDPAAELDERSGESPGFDGTVRLCTSLIADDLLAGHVTQSQGLAEIWPAAMNHPQKLYGGPVTRAQLQAWGVPVPKLDGKSGGGLIGKRGVLTLLVAFLAYWLWT